MAKQANNTDPRLAAYASDADLASYFGVGRATIWRWTKSQGLPAPVKLSAQISRWRLADVRAWEHEQAASRKV